MAGDNGKVFLFEEADLKTVYNLSDLVAETEPEHLDGLSEDVKPDLEKRKLIFDTFHPIEWRKSFFKPFVIGRIILLLLFMVNNTIIYPL